MNELISTKDVVTRKPHRCFGCAREFPSGISMRKDFVADYKPFTAYLCGTCRQVVENMDWNDSYGLGDLRQDAEEIEQKAKQDGGAE